MATLDMDHWQKNIIWAFMVNTGASYLDTAVHFKLNNPSLIVLWKKEFNEQGVEGLNPKLKEPPSMSNNSKKQKKREEKKDNTRGRVGTRD